MFRAILDQFDSPSGMLMTTTTVHVQSSTISSAFVSNIDTSTSISTSLANNSSIFRQTSRISSHIMATNNSKISIQILITKRFFNWRSRYLFFFILSFLVILSFSIYFIITKKNNFHQTFNSISNNIHSLNWL